MQWRNVQAADTGAVVLLQYTLLGPVSVRPGDHWLSMFVADGSYLDLAIVVALWVRYKL